jgi:hypothetical protein
MEDLHQGHARSENTVTLIFVFVMALILRNNEITRIRDSKVEYGKELELSFINYQLSLQNDNRDEMKNEDGTMVPS